MNIIHAVVLGLVQGLTEFLPVSSSGHLIIIPYLLGWQIQDLSFDVVLHLATALAVLFYFYKDWIWMLKSFLSDLSSPLNFLDINKLRRGTKILLMLMVVSIPVAVVGILIEPIVEDYFRSPIVVATMLVLIGIFLIIADIVNNPDPKDSEVDYLKSDVKIPFIKVLIVSLSQILAFIPGTSRSGITLLTGLTIGLKRAETAKYSFMMATPLMIGGGLYEIYNLLKTKGPVRVFIIDPDAPNIIHYIVGFSVAFISGLIAVKLLFILLKKRGLWCMGIYRIVLGIYLVFLILETAF